MFKCQWVRGTVVDPDYGMLTVDLNNVGFKEEPFVLAKDVSQVFYVKDMASKPKRGKANNDQPKRHIILSGKTNLVGIEDRSDKSLDYEKEAVILPFKVNIDPSIVLSEEDTPWSRPPTKSVKKK